MEIEDTKWVTNNTLQNSLLGGFSTSFDLTYHERLYGV